MFINLLYNKCQLYREYFFIRVYWLAEQGLAPKRVFFVVIPLIIIFLIELLKYVCDSK